MIRREFTLASVLSLFLCAATMAMWMSSFKIVDEVDSEDVNLSLGNRHVALDWADHLIASAADNCSRARSTCRTMRTCLAETAEARADCSRVCACWS